MPHLILQRRAFVKKKPTQGSFYFYHNGLTVMLGIKCLELPWEKNKPRASCIPPGTYPMVFSMSPSLARRTWELLNVPGRGGIRIHAGNYAGLRISDSMGCPLPCMSWTDLNGDGVLDGASSGTAVRKLENEMREYELTGLNIEVRNAT